MDNCKFYQIANKKAATKIIYENNNIVCFLPKEIEVYGHTLIAPKKHYNDLYDMPADILCELIKVMQKLALKYKQKINATGINLIYASEKNAQQSIFHFHFHLLPRLKNDRLNT
jgi:histidine triad (HIT) family protein